MPISRKSPDWRDVAIADRGHNWASRRQKKRANEPKWEYPLTMIFQGVNIDAFGFANYKRSQFPGVRHGKQAVADSCCLQATEPRAWSRLVFGPRRNGSGATAKKRANEAKSEMTQVQYIQAFASEKLGPARRERSQFTSEQRVLGAMVDHRDVTPDPGPVRVTESRLMTNLRMKQPRPDFKQALLGSGTIA